GRDARAGRVRRSAARRVGTPRRRRRHRPARRRGRPGGTPPGGCRDRRGIGRVTRSVLRHERRRRRRGRRTAARRRRRPRQGLARYAHRPHRRSDQGVVGLMLYYLLYPLHTTFSVFNVTRYITFRTAAPSLTALALSLLMGPWLIRTLREFQIGQVIRHEGPAT